MNYWVTTHWPPHIGKEEASAGVWVPEGRERAAANMREGDYVAIYEARSGRAELRELRDGTTVRIACQPGREGVICYGAVDSPISAIPNSRPQRYADGTEIWWRWHAPVSVLSASGFLERSDLLQILGYNTSWNLHGFGDYHSGLKKVSEIQFTSLVQAFHESRPIELPVNFGGSGPGYGEGEGETHRNLKNYVSSDPAAALNEPGLCTLGVEYEFPTNDRADIVLVDRHHRIIGVEIEPTVSDIDLVGPLQAIKYRYMLECLTHREPGDSRAILIAHEINKQMQTVCRNYDIECYEIPRIVVDAWVSRRNTI